VCTVLRSDRTDVGSLFRCSIVKRRMKRACFSFISLLIAIQCSVLAISAQQTATIEISGDVQKTMTVTAADLLAMPRVTVVVAAAAYGGVLLEDVLKKAGVPSGSTLRGKALTTYVLAEAQDGYQVVFSLGELDPSVTDNQVVLADSSDGKPLADTEGPFRLVIPKDKLGARSVRMLRRLRVVQVTK
jgi:DMSO/TMAO reductase YedYZ molybdopterin-dependent catalytic subunit